MLRSLLLVLCIVLTPAALAEAQTRQFKDVRWNGSKPIRQGEEITFSLQPGQCSARSYGDGRGESDCNGGRVRSQVQAPGSVRVGSAVEYRMEFFIPRDFSYSGDRNFPSGTRLLIAEWKRSEGIKTHVYEILLDSRRGATVRTGAVRNSVGVRALEHFHAAHPVELGERWVHGGALQ